MNLKDLRSAYRGLVLNIAPVVFSQSRVKCGFLDPEEGKSIKELRDEFSTTHAFRFDKRMNQIVNISIKPNCEPIGKIQLEDISDHLYLLAEALEKKLFLRLKKHRTVLKARKPIVFQGKKDRLLTNALKSYDVRRCDERIDMVAKYEIAFRVIKGVSGDEISRLGIAIKVNTSIILDLPVSELLSLGVSPLGKYVGVKDKAEPINRFQLIGRVAEINGSSLFLNDIKDPEGKNEVGVNEVLLEPRRESFFEVLQKLYPNQNKSLRDKLVYLEAEYSTGPGQLRKVQQTLNNLNDPKFFDLKLGEDLEISFGKLIQETDSIFPLKIETNEPNMLFGSSGYSVAQQPNKGINSFGPYMFTQNPINTPLIAVIFNKNTKGRIEQFVQELRNGVPNAFFKGLIGNYRLTDIKYVFKEVESDTKESYIQATNSILQDANKIPNLAIVQTSEEHKARPTFEDPYFIAKSRFMTAGVPVQALRLETINSSYGRQFILNNFALGCYAKIGGIPWLIQTRDVPTHEIIIGIGSTSIKKSRFGMGDRYVGLTTLFQGDGRYLVWEATKEVKYENYPQELLVTLRRSIKYVREQNAWKPGDSIRLIFHIYKPLRRKEIEAAKALVSELVPNHAVEFAFLNISTNHSFQLFDGRNQPTSSTNKFGRGEFVPDRGCSIQLNSKTALIQLVGKKGVKTWYQGIPRPLQIELHPDSDFEDLTYLVRQIHHFSFMSWRTISPSDEPVTIIYSRLISELLGKLKSLSSWNPNSLVLMKDKKAMWFL